MGVALRGDQSDLDRARTSLQPSVDDRKHHAIAGTASRKPALLVFAVFQIGDAEQSNVIEDCTREVEGNPMLAHIGGGLDFVPLELKLPLIHNPFPRKGR